MIKRIFSFVFTAIIGSTAFSQDPEFTQFYAAPLYLNPAFAGATVCPRMTLNYRNQWPNLSGTFVTYAASYDQYVRNLSGGIGFLLLTDRAGEGTISNTQLSGMYSYHVDITRKLSFKAALQATFVQKRVDWTKLRFGDQIDPRRGWIYETQEQQEQDMVLYPDFSAGMLLYSQNYYGGLAVNHLHEPDESFFNSTNKSPLPRKYTVHVGGVIPLDRKRVHESTLSPNILFQMQEEFQQINVGLYLSRGPMVGGLWYRNGDSFIALIGIQQGMFKFGYSYDATISKLGNPKDGTHGAHEFSIALQFKCRERKNKLIACPSF
ncbi:MAG: type IX secretion system membrane protein PorP/SprF [Bacteroidia bacterium]|nr:type IX secretion system membrane protein PorP/SprF [Bacteroidia bacterium]